MRDRTERVCSSSWDTEAVLPIKDKQLALAKTLRQDDEAASRLQLRLMEPTP